MKRPFFYHIERGDRPLELFKLFGTIALDNTNANKGIDDTTDKAEKAHPKISKAFEKIGNAAVKAGQVIATGLAAGSAAIGKLVSDSVSNYAEYEQLIGGVETLYGTEFKTIEEYAESLGKKVSEVYDYEWEEFQNRQETVLANAANAYKTAGLSANEYMDTVNGFAASLTSSLGEYGWQAANYADMIVTDMADNANKMGTSMEAIQNAYSGFAKQNYTMLDNLKLGYGGTKEEMERLLRDAEKYAGFIEGSLKIESFADIATAINIVQEEMGISGTTAAEASSTIQGSISTMKSAWTNFITGMADDNQSFDILLENLINSLLTVADNLIPRLQILLPRLVEGLGVLIMSLLPYLPDLVESLLPGLIEGATLLLIGLAQMLPTIIQVLIDAIPGVISQIKEALFQQFPQLEEPFNNLKTWMSEMWAYIQEEFEPVLSKLREAFDRIRDAIQPVIDKISEYVSSGEAGEDATNFLKDAISFLADVLETVIDLFLNVTDWMAANKEDLETLGIIVGGFAAAWVLVNTAVTLWNTIGSIATAITTGFGAAVAFLTSPIGIVVVAIGALIAIIAVLVKNWDKVKEGAIAVWEGIKGVWEKVSSWFDEKVVQPISNLFTNLWEGIKEAFKKPINWIIDGINSFIRGINKIKIPDWVPVVGGKGFNIKEIPRLEKGGILEKGQVGLLEGNGAEAVVPLDQNQAWIKAVAQDMQGAMGGSGATKLLEAILEVLNALDDGLVDKFVEAFGAMRFTINNREFGRMVKAVN